MATGATGSVTFTTNTYGGTQVMTVYWKETYSSVSEGATSTVSVERVTLRSNAENNGLNYHCNGKIRISGKDASGTTKTWDIITLEESTNKVYLNSGDETNVTDANDAQITGSISGIAPNADGTKNFSITFIGNSSSSAYFYAEWQHPTGRWYTYTYTFSNSTGSPATSNLKTMPVGTLSTSADTYSRITVNRTSTPSLAASSSTGTITSGALLYHGDALTITFSVTSSNYEIITHTVNGSSFNSGSSYSVSYSTNSGNVTVVAQSRALSSTISATNANIGGTSSISITRYNSSYYQSIQYSFGSQSGYITSSGGTSSSESKWQGTSVSWTIPSGFYSAIPNNASGTCTLTCRTYPGSSGSQLGTSTTTSITISVPSTAKPTVSGTVVDTNNATIAVTGNSSMLVRYMSNARCTISASSSYSTSIATKSINGNVLSGSATTLDYNQVSTGTFVFRAVDNRGLSNEYTATPTIVNYVQLSCNPTITRDSPTGSTLFLALNGNYFNGYFGASSTSPNTLTLEYRYKLASASSFPAQWSTISSGYTISGNGYTMSQYSLGTSFSYTDDYDFQIRATDRLSSVTRDMPVTHGVPVFDWGKDDFVINVNAKGKVLGLGEAWRRIPANSDFNYFTDPGVYAVYQTVDISTIANRPADVVGTLRVWSANGTGSSTSSQWAYLIQEYISINGETWRRRFDTEAGAGQIRWQPWQNVLANGGSIRSVTISGTFTVAANGTVSAQKLTVPTGYEYFCNSVTGTEWEIVPHVVIYQGGPTVVLANVSTQPHSTTLSGKVYFIRTS